MSTTPRIHTHALHLLYAEFLDPVWQGIAKPREIHVVGDPLQLDVLTVQAEALRRSHVDGTGCETRTDLVQYPLSLVGKRGDHPIKSRILDGP